MKCGSSGLWRKHATLCQAPQIIETIGATSTPRHSRTAGLSLAKLTAALRGERGRDRDGDPDRDRDGDRGFRGLGSSDDDRWRRRRDDDCHWVVRRYCDDDGDWVERCRRVCD
jgi:hypothetical protein